MDRVGDTIHTQNLLRVKSPTCLGQNLDSSCYSGFNKQDNNYDGDEHKIIHDEELPEKSRRAERCLACISIAELWAVGI